MLVKAAGWIVVGYLFGILGFAFAEFFDTFGKMDLVTALIHSIVEGIKWPLTLFELVTGKTGGKPTESLLN